MRLLKIYPKLVLLIVALTFSTTALAYDEWAVDIDHLTYGLDKTNKTATVSKRESYTYTEINIPSEIKYGGMKYTVTAIAAKAFKYEGSEYSPITSVTIPATVETIGDYAFQDCSGLTSIKIPASVKSIGINAFYKTDDASSNLTTVEFEEGSVLETIGEYAFGGCYKLKGVKIPASVKSIGKFAFSAWGKAPGETDESSSLITVEFEENSQLETIGNAAFQDCKSLTRIVIPEGVKNIGSSAFLGCSALEYAEIPSTVTYVGHAAFKSCTNVKAVCKISASCYESQGMLSGNEIFGNSPNVKIYVPSSLKSGYESRKSDLGVTNDQIIELDEINVAVSQGGYATLCRECPLDFKGSGLKAYVVDINSSAKNYVVLSEVTNKNIKKETALILKGEPSETYTIFKAVDEGVEAGNEYLFGTVEAAGVEFTDIQNKDKYQNSTLYILAEPNGNVGFYKPKPAADGGTNTVLNQYRACLLWPNDLPKSENMPSTAPKNTISIVVNNGGTTGIEHINNSADDNIHNGNRTVYNLNGQRVENPGKGLYIVNGKKMVIK